MNEIDPKDPFLPMLEEALAMPDLELGHEMRHRLLAAAVSQDQAPAGGNVVPFVKQDGEADAFQWLVGEREADHALMLRLTEDAGFFTAVSHERRFLHTLRRSLRTQIPVPAEVASVPAPVTAIPRRSYRAMAGAVAALLALWLGLKAFDGVPGTSSGELAVHAPALSPAASRPPAAAHPVADEGMVAKVAPLVRGRVKVSPAQEDSETPRVGEAITATVESPDDAGTTPLLEIAQAEKIAAKELFGGTVAQAFAALPGDVENGLVASTGEIEGAQQSPDWGFWNNSLASNSLRGDGSFSYVSDGDGSLAVPEPGGAVLFSIGGVLLLIRRRRKKGH